MHNPYQTPASSTADITLPTRKRPLSVWLLLLILGATLIFHAIGTVAFLRFIVSYQPQEHIRVVEGIAARLGILALGGAILLGVLRRRQWGRWLAVLAMGALTVALFFIPDTAQYANETQRSGGFVGRTILSPALMVWWIYAFGFSSKARRYFGN
ncbi:hypothetical protein [Massilia scottii]|uniref:hypothetical protein n=1 Tax=Massilia scottii TaxID=3057166 RepID=UPI0027967BE2|nr:hypothetical protein [Massilia sp. CCM 9029]MDQ1834627.1 hypothetical protein [Massilia sp. CCM 9029]